VTWAKSRPLFWQFSICFYAKRSAVTMIIRRLLIFLTFSLQKLHADLPYKLLRRLNTERRADASTWLMGYIFMAAPMAYLVETKDRASEIKFLVDPDKAGGIRSWARQKLQADPHGAGIYGDEYLITSLYFDTENFDVFRQHGSYGRSKYRIRRYDNNDAVFLERKMRTRRVLSKRRTIVHSRELSRLAADYRDDAWAGAWFRERLHLRRFSPRIQISYHRTARVAETEVGTIRLTIDENLQALPSEDLLFQTDCGNPILHDRAIVEFKFRVAMPAIFKLLAEQFAIEPQRTSKYRMAATALGLVPPLSSHSANDQEERIPLHV
jgi:hypothetical protein